jgi:hypothetical protein
MHQPNYRYKPTREALGLVNASDICAERGYSNISVLNRLVVEKKAPKPDLIVGDGRLRLWRVERMGQFPDAESTRNRSSKHGDYDPAMQMDAKQLKLLRDTQSFYRVLAQCRSR